MCKHTEKHHLKEGSRFHVLLWDNSGVHCSEPNCEVNCECPDDVELSGSRQIDKNRRQNDSKD